MPGPGPGARGRGGCDPGRTTGRDEPAYVQSARVGPLRSSGSGCLTFAVHLGPVPPA